MVHLRILHTKNKPSRPKTVAYRPRTDRHTDTQTERQTEKANTEDPFFRFFFFLIFDFLLKERSDNEEYVEAWDCVYFWRTFQNWGRFWSVFVLSLSFPLLSFCFPVQYGYNDASYNEFTATTKNFKSSIFFFC